MSSSNIKTLLIAVGLTAFASYSAIVPEEHTIKKEPLIGYNSVVMAPIVYRTVRQGGSSTYSSSSSSYGSSSTSSSYSSSSYSSSRSSYGGGSSYGK